MSKKQDVKEIEPAAEGPPSNAFLHVLQHHNDGEALAELADAMRECITAVQTVGKPARLQISVTFAPAARAAYAVSIGEPKVKLPPVDRPASLWFGDGDGNLHREDPRQPQLPLKTVPAEPAREELRQAK